MTAKAIAASGRTLRLPWLPWIALAAVVVGVFSTWASAGPVTLNGTEGPGNGWLVLIVVCLAAAWVRSMHRGSWIGIAAELGASGVIVGTALAGWWDNREILDATVGWGLLLVAVAGVLLGAAAVAAAVDRGR